mgnify:CR=1 FL=1
MLSMFAVRAIPVEGRYSCRGRVEATEVVTVHAAMHAEVVSEDIY